MSKNRLKRCLFYLPILIFLFIDYVSLYKGLGFLEGMKKTGFLNIVFPAIHTAILAVAVLSIKREISSLGPAKVFLIVLLLAAGTFYFLKLNDAAGKVHFLEYELITLLIYKAVNLDIKSRWAYLLTIAAVLFVGITEEIIQASFPDRTFDLRDLKIDIISSVFMTAVLFTLKERILPKERPDS